MTFPTPLGITPGSHVPQFQIPIDVGQSILYEMAGVKLSEITPDKWVGKDDSCPKQNQGGSAEQVQRVLVSSRMVRIFREFHDESMTAY
jgi:hypothetical protein